MDGGIAMFVLVRLGAGNDLVNSPFIKVCSVFVFVRFIGRGRNGYLSRFGTHRWFSRSK